MPENIFDGVCFQSRSRLQVEQWDKSGLHHSCFPRNFEQLFFGTFQNRCFNYLVKSIFAWLWKTPRFSCNILFSLFRKCFPFLPTLQNECFSNYILKQIILATEFLPDTYVRKLKYRPSASQYLTSNLTTCFYQPMACENHITKI